VKGGGGFTMGQIYHYEGRKPESFDPRISRMDLATAVSLHQKLKEFLRTSYKLDEVGVRKKVIRWMPQQKPNCICWEPTFEEFIKHYNIIIL
jgi:endo-1,4-beta-mannosidase